MGTNMDLAKSVTSVQDLVDSARSRKWKEWTGHTLRLVALSKRAVQYGHAYLAGERPKGVAVDDSDTGEAFGGLSGNSVELERVP